MRLLLLAALLAPAAQAAPVLAVSSDQATYPVGAIANFSAVALTMPENSADDFYIGATLNGTAITVTQTSGQGLSQATLASPGAYTWTVQLYLEDATLARQLNGSIQALELQDDQLETEIAGSTNPTQTATWQAQLTQNQSVITEAQNLLAQIRQPFGPSQSLTVQAQ